jgi:tRNA(adenine34) deaminase
MIPPAHIDAPPEDADETFMKQALAQAQIAFEAGEIPVGAVIVLGSRIIARGHNQVERLSDATAHAEMIALSAAFGALGAKYLPEATLYVTLEPCVMCAGALYWSKIGRVVYGAPDEKNGYRQATGGKSPFHPKTRIYEGVLGDRCGELMREFFRQRRRKGRPET